jgi:hypothetical protein
VFRNIVVAISASDFIVLEEILLRTVITSLIAKAQGEGTNSPRLFTPGETKALAKSKVHQ